MNSNNTYTFSYKENEPQTLHFLGENNTLTITFEFKPMNTTFVEEPIVESMNTTFVEEQMDTTPTETVYNMVSMEESFEINEPFIQSQPQPLIRNPVVDLIYIKKNNNGIVLKEKRTSINLTMMNHLYELSNYNYFVYKLLCKSKHLQNAKVCCNFINDFKQKESPCLHTNARLGMRLLNSDIINDNQMMPIKKHTNLKSYHYYPELNLYIKHSPAHITIQQIIMNMLLYRGRSKMILKLKSSDPLNIETLTLFSPCKYVNM